MALDKVTYAAAKKYVDKSIAGGGISAGKNCTIDNISPITGGNRVTFKWTLDDGTVQTQTMDVMNGDKGDTGDAGLGIKAVSINTQNHLIITFDDDTTYDAGELPGGSGEVISVNGKKGVVTLDANDVGALPDDTELFSGDYNDLDNLPDLTKFITNTVDNLVNYYKKTETYTKTEVDGIANTIKNSRFEVVFTLPTTDIKTNVIYLVPKPTTQTQNVKDEYINLDGTSAGWEKIGDTEIDLSGYVTTTALNTALADYTTTTDLTTLLAGKVDKVTGKGLSTNDYANTDKELVDSIPSLAPISLLKSTVGWNGKNLLPNNSASTKTGSNVTYTRNSDKSVSISTSAASSAVTYFDLTNPQYAVSSYETIEHFPLLKKFQGKEIRISSGTNNANIRITLTIKDSSKNIKFDIRTDGSAGTSNKGIVPALASTDVVYYTVRLASGVNLSEPVIVKPMVCDSSYPEDIDYAPYHPSVEEEIEQIYADNGVLGAKNLFRNPYYDGTSKTSNGVTFTVNNDGSITVDTNGVASTGEASFRLIRYDRDQDIINTFNEKTLKKSGTDGDVYVQGYWSGATHREDEFIVNASTMTNWNFAVYVASGKTIDNVTIYPMLRLASDPDDTYVPYAMTNRELTEEVNALPREVFVTTDTRTTTTNDANTLPCGFTRMNDANSNLPTDGTGGNVWYDILTVRQSNDSSRETWGYGFQLAVQTTTNANMGDMYVRAVNGGSTPTWSAWKKLN